MVYVFAGRPEQEAGLRSHHALAPDQGVLRRPVGINRPGEARHPVRILRSP